jgi:hypothetical protein
VLYVVAFAAGCAVAYSPKVRGYALRGGLYSLAAVGALALLALIV